MLGRENELNPGCGIGRTMRAALAMMLVALGAAACDKGPAEDEFSAVGDTTRLVESMGEVSLTADGAIQGEVTSGMYRRWLLARQALVRAGVSLPSNQRLRGYGNADVDRLVAQLEKNSRARSAIEDAGMSVRNWVITGVALERQLALATGPQRRAMEEAARAPLDSGLTQPYPADAPPMPQPMPQPVPEPFPREPLPQDPLPQRPLPADPRPVPVPVPPTETTPSRSAPTPPPPSRPAPRDTLRLEPIPAPSPAPTPQRPESDTTPAEPRSSN